MSELKPLTRERRDAAVREFSRDMAGRLAATLAHFARTGELPK